MQRRDALKNVALLVGAGLISESVLTLLSCNTATKKSNGQLLSDDQQNIVTELADVIIPATSSPGAKAAGVGPFIAMMLQDCCSDDVQKDFIDGLDNFSKTVKDQFGKDFVSLSAQDKIKAVSQLRDKTVADKKSSDKTVVQKSEHFFPAIYSLTQLGYFTSEIGATQAMAYVAVPGRYDGSADLKPGQKAWAPDGGWGMDNALKS